MFKSKKTSELILTINTSPGSSFKIQIPSTSIPLYELKQLIFKQQGTTVDQ